MTPTFQATVESGKKIDNSSADQKTKTLMEHWHAQVMQLGNVALQASDIAATIKDIILGKNTSFRCQANGVGLVNEMIAAKLKDVASNEPIGLMAKQFSNAE